MLRWTHEEPLRRPSGATGARLALTVVLVRYFAAARAAAGLESETISLSDTGVAGALPRQEVERALVLLHPDPTPGQPRLRDVLERASFLLNGVACTDPAAAIPDDATLDVLPPFAGG